MKRRLGLVALVALSVVALTGCGDSGDGVVATNGGVVSTLAGTSGASGSTDGTGAAARFNGPYGIATDGTNVYVGDVSNSTIRKVVIATGAVTTLAGLAGASGSTDGTGTAARFNGPYAIATDGTNVYVSDFVNNTVRRVVIATGAVTTLAGTAGSSGSTDGTGAAARFNGPEGIATDGTNVYVLDKENDTIRQIVISTGAVTTLAGTAGAPGSADGTGAAARFNWPQGLMMAGGNLYVSDTENHTIRKVVIATGVVTTLAGTAGLSGSTDGTGAAARFNHPEGLSTDGTNLYVADFVNNTVRQVVIATGAVTTLAGTAGSSGSTDGTGAAARFNGPHGIATVGTKIYVGDSNNHTIRLIQ